jgi:hypothetical protein
MSPAVHRPLAIAILVTLALGSAVASAREAGEGITLQELFPWAEFRDNIQTQAEITGVVPGARPLRHSELLHFLEVLADGSPFATLREYGRTHEGRRLVYFAVGDQQTIARLDSFRDEHARRMDPRVREAGQDEAALADAKAVAWMAYGIHGDELSSPDAAAAMAYWLAAGEDERARALRRELLILIDPCENPDGRERYLAQTTAFAHRVPNPDTEDLSHTNVWPWGRGNHYLFDLNRDWFTMVQPESRRSEAIASWNPQLVVDSHEMGAHDTYLFHPSRHPFNPHLPSYTKEWSYRFGADQARALDGRGYAYYTREWNEEFFPGYGSSWARYLGAVGILYEMSRTSGTLVRQRAGTVRTFQQAVEHQVTSSISNLETLAGNRREFLLDYTGGRREAIRRAVDGPFRAWIFPPGRQPERVDELAELLRKQGVEVLRAAEPVRAEKLHDARTGEVSEIDLPAGTWMVPLDQPVAPMARVLLDPHVPMDATFLREEREYQERGKGTRLYDTTAWSLPLAYGVEAYWSESRPPGMWRLDRPKRAQGSLAEAGDAFGYLFEGTSDRSVFAVADLLQRGIAVRIAEKPFGVEGQAYARGAVLVKREGNPEDLADQLREVAERWSISIRATSTARAEEGPDLGGRRFKPLVPPRVGVWTGAMVAPSSYGSIWHLFDEQASLRFTGLDLLRFQRTDLSRYNVLVFPPAWGGSGAYRHALGESGIGKLRQWIEDGGTAIGIGGGAEFLADGELELTQTRLRRQALDRYPPVVLGIGAEEAEAGGLPRASGLRAPRRSKDRGDPEAKKGKNESREPIERSSPYDIAPLIGPGAAPFAEGTPLGTPASMEPVDLATWVKPFLPPGREHPEAEDLERADARLRRFSPRGAMLRVELDPEHWLSFGLPDAITVWTRASDTLVADAPVRVAGRFADPETLHLGGLLWPEAAGRLSRTAYATRESLGRGQVVLFLDHPVFRGWMFETRRMFLNSVLYGPGLGTRWSAPW